MLIVERDRPEVERRLVAARDRDERVAHAIRTAGARLDGTDDLLVLCAVDDELARVLPDAEHPLYRPISFRPRIGRPRPRPPGAVRPGPVTMRVDVDRLLQDFMDPLDELRWPGGGRPGIERIARGLPAWDRHAREHLEACLAAVRVGPGGRVAMQRRAARLSTLPHEVALVEALAAALTRFAEARGAPPRAFVPPAAARLDRAVLEAIARTPDDADEDRRRWLASRAERVNDEPHRLRARSREASELVGVAPPWTIRGPASLAEALDAWRRRYGSPHDLDRMEAGLRDARLGLAASVAELVAETRASLARTPRSARGGDACALLAAALAIAGDGHTAGDGHEPPALDRLVAAGALSPVAVAAAIRRLSDAA